MNDYFFSPLKGGEWGGGGGCKKSLVQNGDITISFQLIFERSFIQMAQYSFEYIDI